MNGWGFEGNAPPNIFEQMQAQQNQQEQQRILEIQALEMQRLMGVQAPESHQELEPQISAPVENNPIPYESSQIEGITSQEDMARSGRVVLNPPFSTVKSLIHLDDAVGDTLYDDVIFGPNTWNRRTGLGSTQVAAAKYGVCGFNCFAGDALQGQVVTLGNGEFQCEGYGVQNPAVGSYIFDTDDVGYNDGVTVVWSGTRWQVYTASGGGLNLLLQGAVNAGIPVAGRFFHWALTRDSSNVVRLFINGSLIGSASYVHNFPAATVWVGADIAGSLFNMTYIDECRIAVGSKSCVYVNPFIPPFTPFPNS